MFRHLSVRQLARNLQSGLEQGPSRLLGRLRSWRRGALHNERQIIEASLLFDTNWYLQKYPDIAAAGIDALDHYLTVGWREGRDPGPAFTTSAYLKANEDVSKAGMNPLLHFVQFGLAEGREGFGDPHLLPGSDWEAVEFADAHRCFSLPRPASRPAVSRKHYPLVHEDPRFVAVGHSGVGYTSGRVDRACVENAVRWLGRLSGRPVGEMPGEGPRGVRDQHRLVDAWFVNMAQVRTRWGGDKLPLVVRAFQLCPSGDGEPRLVAEGAIESPTDILDLHLLDPYFPILFVVADADNALIGIDLLTFPSLCRGGRHYPELLWSAALVNQGPLDVLAVSDALTSRLVALLDQRAEAAVGEIQVNMAGSDGNGPMFRRDLRAWLRAVLQVEISECGHSGPHSTEAHAVTRNSSPSAIRRGEGGALVLPADMAPTIASLVEPRAESGRQEPSRPAALLGSTIDPSNPVIAIDIPATAAGALEGGGDGLPWLMRDGRGAVPAEFPAAAIRTSGRNGIGDARLLVPISGASLRRPGSRVPMTWLVDPSEWTDHKLAEGLQCLALQRGGEADVLALIGPSAVGALGQARKHFVGEVSVFKSRNKALRLLKTPLVASVGAGVLLHDPRTGDCFSSILSNELIATASCVIVSAERRAGVVNTAIVDAGALVKPNKEAASQAESAAAAVELWQGSWPVLRPSTYLWAARTGDLLKTSQGAASDREDPAIHICSSAVTASWLGSSDTTANGLDVRSAKDTSTQVRWLVG